MPKKREEREIERWITVRGARVPIFKGQSVEEAIKESVGNGKRTAKKADAGAKADREKAAVSKENYHLNPNQRRAKETTQNAEAKDRYGKDWNHLTDEQKKSIDDQLKKNHPLWYGGKMNSVEKRANEVWDKAQKTAKTDSEVKPYVMYQKENMLGKDVHTRLEVNYAKSKEEAMAQYKQKYPKAKESDVTTEISNAPEHTKKAAEMNAANKIAKTDGGENARIGVYKKQLKDVQEDIQQFESTPKSLRSKDYDQKLGELKKKERDLKGWIDNDINARRNEDIKEKQLAANKAQAQVASGKRGSTPEFKDYDEAKEYYQKRFAEMSPQNMNRIARNMQIGGRGKEKIAALAEAKAKEWQGKKGNTAPSGLHNQADKDYDEYTQKMEKFYERTGARPYGKDAFATQKNLIPKMSSNKLMQEHVKSGGEVKTAIANELDRRGYTPGADGWVKKSSISSAAKADAGAKKDRMQAAANAINKISDSHNNRGGKEDDWKQVRDILQKAPVGTVMEQTGDRGVKFQYEKVGEDKWKNTDPKYAYESDSKTMSMSWTGNGRRPSVNFTTKDKALTREQVKAAQDAATSGRLNQALGLDKNGNKITRASMAGTGISKESAGAMSNVYDGGKKETTEQAMTRLHQEARAKVDSMSTPQLLKYAEDNGLRGIKTSTLSQLDDKVGNHIYMQEMKKWRKGQQASDGGNKTAKQSSGKGSALVAKSSAALKTMYKNASPEDKKKIAAELNSRGFYSGSEGRWKKKGGGSKS